VGVSVLLGGEMEVCVSVSVSVGFGAEDTVGGLVGEGERGVV
jgi:hypothetical protein